MIKYYKKEKRISLPSLLRYFSILLLLGGFSVAAYVFFPLFMWQIYFAPAFASNDIETPIPKIGIVSSTSIKNLFTNSFAPISGIDYSNAENWFPGLKLQKLQTGNLKVLSYTLSIPKLHIDNATVSTTDSNLDIHLINYIGTAIPADKGNAVIFGHSTLPQLFDQHNYKTILANAYQLTKGDKLIATISGISYSYNIYQITVVDPTDTSMFDQNYNDSEITLITCTPPGTTWKRLIIKARLETI